MNMSDEVWMRLHQKYGMSLIMKNCIQSKQTTNLTLMLLKMINWIDKTINVINEVLMWVH